jgi:hypothetical protein
MQFTRLIVPAVLLIVSAGCGNDEARTSTADASVAADSVTASPEPGSPADAAATPAASPRTGSMTIAGQSWSIVPSVQCGVFPGDVVSISGHAATAESIEIVLDYDAQRGPIQARVQGENDDPHWLAGQGTAENDLEFRIEGKRVTGSGTFTDMRTQEKAKGSFDITC